MKFFCLLTPPYIPLASLPLALALLSCNPAPSFNDYVEERSGGGTFGAAFLKDGFAEIQLDSSLKPKNNFLTQLTQTNTFPLTTSLNKTTPNINLIWTAPPQAKFLPTGKEGTSQFRLATLILPSNLEITLVSFKGEAGGLRANTLRWLSQLNYTPTPRDFSQFLINLQPQKNPVGLPYYFIDFNLLEIKNNPLPRKKNLLAAILKFKDETLFIKLSGNTLAVEKERPAFLEFLNSLQLKK